MNWKKIGIVAIAVIVVLSLLKDVVIKASICSIGSAVIGAPLKIGGFSWNIFTQRIRIKDLRLYNPPGFPNQPLVDISHIAVDYDGMSMLNGKLHFPYINVDLKETVIVKNKEGYLNVDALKVAQQKGDLKAEQANRSVKGEDRSLMIDVIKLNIERTVYLDFSNRDKPVTKVFNVGLRDKTFKNIKSVHQLATVILVQGMGPAAIKGAAIYGAAAVLGVAFLPAGAVAMLVGKDSAQGEYEKNYDEVFNVALHVMKEKGEVLREDKVEGSIKGKVDGVDVNVAVARGDKTIVLVSARKMMLPRAEIAAGFVYQLDQKIK